jgi:hypothetical protein
MKGVNGVHYYIRGMVLFVYDGGLGMVYFLF